MNRFLIAAVIALALSPTLAFESAQGKPVARPRVSPAPRPNRPLPATGRFVRPAGMPTARRAAGPLPRTRVSSPGFSSRRFCRRHNCVLLLNAADGEWYYWCPRCRRYLPVRYIEAYPPGREGGPAVEERTPPGEARSVPDEDDLPELDG